MGRSNGNARPGWGAGGRANEQGWGSAQAHDHFRPEALAIQKRGRLCVVAKVTTLDSRPILAIAVRGQKGTERMISLPLQVLDHAEARGCRELFWRLDRHPLEMRRIALADVRAGGWLQRDGELYIPLVAMEAVPWRRWPYAETVVRVGPDPEATPPPSVVQGSLWAAS